jgi:hypothetical protein
MDLRTQFKGGFDGLLTAHLLEIDLALSQKAQGALDPGGIADLTTSPTPAPDAGGAQPPAGPAGAPGAAAAPPGTQAAGSARAMANSNQNSGAVASLPGGPAMQGTQAPL